MLQAYTTAATVTGSGSENIAFSKVEFTDSTATANPGAATIKLNAPGVYMVNFNATGTTTDAGTFGVQMYRDGELVEQATGAATTTAGSAAAISFSTLMSVSACCCGNNGGATLTFRYTGGAGTISLANVVVVKVR